VSAAGDGPDVAEGEMWVTQAHHDIFTLTVADARAELDDRSATDDERTKARSTVSRRPTAARQETGSAGLRGR
jgi:hypothetical protein